jgi:predicted DNA binding CopG/RHH family protein
MSKNRHKQKGPQFQYQQPKGQQGSVGSQQGNKFDNSQTVKALVEEVQQLKSEIQDVVGPKKAHVSPSRARYEAKTHVVSIRLSNEEYEALDKLRAERGFVNMKQLVLSLRGYEGGNMLHLGRCDVCGRPFTIHLDVESQRALLDKAVSNELHHHPACAHPKM